MERFYEVMKRVYDNHNSSPNRIWYPVPESAFYTFDLYGGFLDDIPDNQKESVAEELLIRLSEYCAKDSAYLEAYTEDRKRMDKLKVKHLKIAKKFLAIMDNVPDDIIDQYELFKEHSRKTNTPMRLSEDGILAALVAKYIRQIENDETSYPSMIKKYKYKNYPPKPPKSIFVDYLKEISREYSLTGVTDALSNISKYINDTIKE